MASEYRIEDLKQEHLDILNEIKMTPLQVWSGIHGICVNGTLEDWSILLSRSDRRRFDEGESEKLSALTSVEGVRWIELPDMDGIASVGIEGYLR